MPAMTAAPDRTWLIGLMGCGKSTVGAGVAQVVGVTYTDNDRAVGVLAGRSTVDLAGEGGSVLHDWESRYVGGLVGLDPPVVAGIPASIAERPGDLDLLAGSGLLVYLRVDPATLAARVARDPPRPWLGADPAALLTAMFAVRDPVLTAAASRVIDATAVPATVVTAVLAARAARLEAAAG
jgi:shikimate kinase